MILDHHPCWFAWAVISILRFGILLDARFEISAVCSFFLIPNNLTAQATQFLSAEFICL